jgi:predicted AlkP superfamily pyrophosphatase or phosphodiesterase
MREFVVVHCDSVDWFSHRFGPRTTAGGVGWQLADDLLGDLVDRLQPESVVIVSDHGVTEVTAFVLIHDAVHRAGLAPRASREMTTLVDLAEQPVFCLSSSGALWCRSRADVRRAIDLLLELGAISVERVAPSLGAPAVVPQLPDGWVALVAPEDYPARTSDLVLRSGPLFDTQRAEHNWMGDHSPIGLLATDDETLWVALEGARLHEVKHRLIALA